MRKLLLILLASVFSAIYCFPTSSAVNEILINEVELNPAGSDIGAEKLELYNPSSSVIDLSGWTVSSTAGTAAAIVIKERTTIPPNGYLIVGIDSQWLDNTEETVELWDGSGNLIDSVGLFSDVKNDAATWQRSPDGGDNWVFSRNTMGSDNFVSFASEPDCASSLAAKHPIWPIPSSPTNSTVEVTHEIEPSQNLTISFINVGQGDSILVILPNTKTLLIDGGERESSGKVLETLQEVGLSHIDVVVATHPHADHIGGLIDVITNVNVGQVLDSNQMYTTHTFEDFLDAIDTEQIPLKSVGEGDSIDLDPTVKIDVLNPSASLSDGADNEAEFNDNSVVLKLTYGEFSALLTGDMQKTNEARLVLKNATALDAEVLKAGHHGSRTSSSLPFLKAVTPKVVIISLAAGNNYGHPHQEALDRLSAAGTELMLRTDVDGTITLTANGSSGYSIVTETSDKSIDVLKSEMVCYSLQ